MEEGRAIWKDEYHFRAYTLCFTAGPAVVRTLLLLRRVIVAEDEKVLERSHVDNLSMSWSR